jgi:large subunit ribosomal protein L27
MAANKKSSSSRLGRDSASQRLGIKAHDGQFVKVGMIIVRQRGTKYLVGRNVKKGSDDTIYAMINGIVRFSDVSKRLFDNSRRSAKVVSVEATK